MMPRIVFVYSINVFVTIQTCSVLPAVRLNTCQLLVNNTTNCNLLIIRSSLASYISTERSLDVSCKGGFAWIALHESLKANGVSSTFITSDHPT